MSRPWEWRKSAGGWTLASDGATRRFHAYDVNNNAACEPSNGLFVSVEEVNEGSDLCPSCAGIIKAEPEGRPKIDYAALREAKRKSRD